jgi:hypothetical protein
VTGKRAFLPEASLINSTPVEGEWCACGAGLFMCEACGDSRCLICYPSTQPSDTCPL